MPASKFFADGPAAVGLNPDKVQALMDRAERDVREGILPACQLAIARGGRIAAMQTFGRAVQGGVEKPATDETLFASMSATKALTSAALWLLIHTAGIPRAPGSFKDWGNRDRRLQRFAQWRAEHQPGGKFIYHIHANY